MESIFRRIEKCIKQTGELPKNFVLEEEKSGNGELYFAPGALEGIIGHHTAIADENGDFIEELNMYLGMDFADALNSFEEKRAKGFKTATIRDGLLSYIMSHKQEYDPNRLGRLAVYFMEHGQKIESVKLGLTLLYPFDLHNNSMICYAFELLGYCDEFTDYVILNAKGWPVEQQQELYFELARKLHGWGKINAVEMMVADTEEKKEWILCHGCKNDVMYAYLGYECAMKCDLFERLQKGNLSDEEFAGASDIMSGLLDEGPCQGMSALDEPVALTLFYLEECKKHNWDAVQVALITDIAAYFKESEIEDARKIEPKVKEVMSRLDIHTFIIENVEKNTPQCMRIAKMYDIDMSEHLLRLMKMDFEKYYKFCTYFMQDANRVDEFLDLCDRKINYDKYPNAMGNELGLGAVQGDIKLDMVVQYLHLHYGKGKLMIMTCIQSPITRWRTMAVKALLSWVKTSGKTLEEIDINLYNEVKRVHVIESAKQLIPEWEKLLGYRSMNE